ncbi:MAG: D-alanine--D-alanine ligase family protein [Spirochaetota bacterium]
MSKERIGILFGGKSGEHEVSLISAASVFTHIDRSRFEPVLIGIDRDGRWYLQTDPKLNADKTALVMNTEPEQIVSVLPGQGLWAAAGHIDLAAVFPVLHGTFGEDGTVQGLLEVAGIPYVGAGVLASSLGMDKAMVKRVWIEAGLPTIPFEEVKQHELDSRGSITAVIKRILNKFDFPLFVKPSRSGSSVGVSRAVNQSELQDALESAFKFDTKVMVEPEMQGREVECSVVGNQFPKAYAVGEIVPTDEHQFYDYDAKYLDPEGALLRVPAPLSSEITAAVQELAVAAYKCADTEGFARLDFFITKNNRVVLNEINTIPGFTNISMFPKLCQEAGLGYGSLITVLIELGIERYRERSGLHYTRE